MFGLVIAASLLAASPAPDAPGVYREHCASCHGTRRYGGYGPPLIPQTLDRKSDDALAAAIRDGLPNTQMAAFGDKLDAAQVRALVALLREPVGELTWSLADVAASREAMSAEKPAFPADVDRENLTLVVERGTGSVVVLDGDSLTELDRYPVGMVHGGLKFDRALRQVFASTRDGTLVAYDLVRGAPRTRVKAGINTRNIAVSPDGDFVAAANQLPPGIVVFDGALHPLAAFDLAGQPSGVYYVPDGGRFIAATRDAPLLTTVELPGLGVRTRKLPEPFEDFVFVPGRSQLVASSRGGSQLLLYDYAAERVVAALPTQGLPHLFSACFFPRDGALYAAFNHVGSPRLSIVAMDPFRVEKEIPLRGPGFFARTHPGTPFIWVDTNTEAIQLVDKQSLELLPRTLTPEPGKKAMHVEFTADGKKAFVSVWDEAGAVVVYDSTSLEELDRRPYAMPVGKYNAGNKTRLLD